MAAARTWLTVTKEARSLMATIDVDALRAYLLDYCGTAAFTGFPAAILDVWDIGQASGEQLCREAERLGIDLRRFVVRE